MISNKNSFLVSSTIAVKTINTQALDKSKIKINLSGGFMQSKKVNAE